MAAGELWEGIKSGVWITGAGAVLILVFHLLVWVLSVLRRRRGSVLDPTAASPTLPAMQTPLRSSGVKTEISKIIPDADLRCLMNSLEEDAMQGESWEELIDKKNEQVSYRAKCFKPKNGPLKYLSVTVFEGCTTDTLTEFYMDTEYRKEWDKTLIEHLHMQVDEASGVEIGVLIKKFPFLAPREYLLAWRVWIGKDKTVYCFTKECDHPLVPRQRKYVRVEVFRSFWRIRKAPGRDACEITMLHQEDAGVNVNVAKMAFVKNIWSYVCKMNTALHGYSSSGGHMRSTSIVNLWKLIQKVPPDLDASAAYGNDIQDHCRTTAVMDDRTVTDASGNKFSLNPTSKKWIRNGLFLLGLVCLCRRRSNLGAQLAVVCVLEKLMKNQEAAEQTKPARSVARCRNHLRAK